MNRNEHVCRIEFLKPNNNPDKATDAKGGEKSMTSKDGNKRFKFFLPNARILSETEISAIPAEKKKAAETEKTVGVWLEINCPDASCLSEDGRITIPARGHESAQLKGFWLNLFCPEESCELHEATDLP